MICVVPEYVELAWVEIDRELDHMLALPSRRSNIFTLRCVLVIRNPAGDFLRAFVHFNYWIIFESIGNGVMHGIGIHSQTQICSSTDYHSRDAFEPSYITETCTNKNEDRV